MNMRQIVPVQTFPKPYSIVHVIIPSVRCIFESCATTCVPSCLGNIATITRWTLENVTLTAVNSNRVFGQLTGMVSHMKNALVPTPCEPSKRKENTNGIHFIHGSVFGYECVRCGIAYLVVALWPGMRILE